MLVILAKRLSEYCPDSVPSQITADLRRLYLHGAAESMRKVAEAVRAGSEIASTAGEARWVPRQARDHRPCSQ